MPQKGFGSAVCEQRNREIVHIVSETADPIPFRGTPHRKFKAQKDSIWPFSDTSMDLAQK